MRDVTKKDDRLETFKAEDEIIFCGACCKEPKISRNNFLLETLDAATRCCGCEQKQSVETVDVHVTNHGICAKNIAGLEKFSDE